MFCHWYPTKTCDWSNPVVRSSWDNVVPLRQHDPGRPVSTLNPPPTCPTLLTLCLWTVVRLERETHRCKLILNKVIDTDRKR